MARIVAAAPYTWLAAALSLAQVAAPDLALLVVVGLAFGGAGLDTVRGCVLTRLAGGDTRVTDLTSYDDWRAALVDVTRLPLAGVADDDLRGLFARMLQAHRAWDAAGRP